MSDRFSLTRSTTSAAILVALGSEYGASPNNLLEGTGIDPVALHDPTTEISMGQELALLRNLLREVDEPGLGLVAGTRYRLGTHGIWGFALLTSRDLGSAVEVGLRYADLTYTFAEVRIEIDRHEARIHYDIADTPEDVREFQVQRDFVAAHSVILDGLGPETTQRWFSSAQIDVALPAPADPAIARLVADQLGVAPTWEAPQTVIRFPTEILRIPLPQARPEEAARAEAACADLLARRRQRLGFAGQVRGTLMTHRRATVDQAAVAQQLNVSVRTLRRRLTDEGTSFREVVAETAGLLAEELLQTGLSVEQVALRLGYASPSSFTRAFKAWRGVPPGAYARGDRQD